jgi:hypothetical protein
MFRKMSYIQRYWNENKISHKFNTPIKGLYLKIGEMVILILKPEYGSWNLNFYKE